MAKNRYFNTRFWSDNFIVGLNPLERYLFMYFLLNEHTNICGVYEIPLRTMAFETGIDHEMLPKMIERFKGKIEYIDNWVWIVNFVKYQSTGSEYTQKGIKRCFAEVPEPIQKAIELLKKKK